MIDGGLNCFALVTMLCANVELVEKILDSIDHTDLPKLFSAFRKMWTDFRKRWSIEYKNILILCSTALNGSQASQR